VQPRLARQRLYQDARLVRSIGGQPAHGRHALAVRHLEQMEALPVPRVPSEDAQIHQAKKVFAGVD